MEMASLPSGAWERGISTGLSYPTPADFPGTERHPESAVPFVWVQADIELD